MQTPPMMVILYARLVLYIYYNILTRPKKYIIIRLLSCRARLAYYYLLLYRPLWSSPPPPPHPTAKQFSIPDFFVYSNLGRLLCSRKINYKPSVYYCCATISYTKRVRIPARVCGSDLNNYYYRYSSRYRRISYSTQYIVLLSDMILPTNMIITIYNVANVIILL